MLMRRFSIINNCLAALLGLFFLVGCKPLNELSTAPSQKSALSDAMKSPAKETPPPTVKAPPPPLPPPPSTLTIDLQPTLEALAGEEHEPLDIPRDLRVGSVRGQLGVGVVTPRHLLLYSVDADGRLNDYPPVTFEPGTTELHLCGVHVVDADLLAVVMHRYAGGPLIPALVSFGEDDTPNLRSLPMPKGVAPGFAGGETCRSFHSAPYVGLLMLDETSHAPHLLRYDQDTPSLIGHHPLSSTPVDAVTPSWSFAIRDDTLLLGVHLWPQDTSTHQLETWSATLSDPSAAPTKVDLSRDTPTRGGVAFRGGVGGAVFIEHPQKLDREALVPLLWRPFDGSKDKKPQEQGLVSPRGFDHNSATLTLGERIYLLLTPPQPTALPRHLGALVEASDPDAVLLHREKIRAAEMTTWDEETNHLVVVFLSAERELWPAPMKSALELVWFQ